MIIEYVQYMNPPSCSQGQKLDDKHVEALAALPDDAPLLDKILIRHRRTVGNILL